MSFGGDLRIRNPLPKNGKLLEHKGLSDCHESCLDSCLAFSLQEHPELEQVVERWPDLPEHVRQAILCLLK